MSHTLTEDPALSNLFGPLSPDLRERLREVLGNPRRYWDRDHGLILRSKGMLTLWQAVLAVDPTFPRTGPVSRFNPKTKRSRRVEGWARYPDQMTVARAIKHAVKGVA